MIQHDCGHGSFFQSRRANDWVGRVIGVVTLTPYDHWRRSHAVHHASSGNLDRRGIGDVYTLTVDELRDVSRLTLFQSLRSVRLVLWDYERRRLVALEVRRRNAAVEPG